MKNKKMPQLRHHRRSFRQNLFYFMVLGYVKNKTYEIKLLRARNYSNS